MRWVLLTRIPDGKPVWINLALCMSMGRGQSAQNESYTWLQFLDDSISVWVEETPEDIFSKAIASNWGNL